MCPKTKVFQIGTLCGLGFFGGNVCSKIKVSACVHKTKYKAHYLFVFFIMCVKEGNIWVLLCEGTSNFFHLIIIKKFNIDIFKSS
jgi:hypothetical protein